MATTYNKVTFNAATLLSLENDTITAADLRTGVTAHDATGQAIVGTYSPSGVNLQSKTKSYTPSATAQSETVTADSGYDGLSSVEVSVGAISSTYVGSGITRRSSSDLTASGATVTVPAGYYESQGSKAVASGTVGYPSWSNTKTETSITFVGSYENFTPGYISSISDATRMLSLQEETVTPSTTQRVITPATANSFLNKVTVEAIPSGTAGTPTATKGTVSDASVTVTPSVTNTTGYIEGGTKTGTAVTVTARELVSGNSLTADDYGPWDVADYETLTIPAGTEGTPTAIKSNPSNHRITVTPSVVNSAGWIDGRTKTGTAVTVEAWELVIDSEITIDGSGSWDVTNAATAIVPAGTEGTPSATKGTVSNHSVSVTPSVTNSAGWIDGGTKTGTAVSVSASELVSGTLQVTANGTQNVTNYASVNVQVPYVTYYTGTSDPSASLGQNGDIYLKVVG